MQKTKKDRQNERGSALLLVLGILSLVLIMGMSFVFTARTERQVAQANSSQMSAKLIAQSALNRVISDMGFYFFDDKNGNGAVDDDEEALPYPAADLQNDNADTSSDPISFALQDQSDSDGLQFMAMSKNLSISSVDSGEQDYFSDLLHLDTANDSDSSYQYYESLPHLTMLEKAAGKQTFTHPVTVKYKDADGKWCTDVIGRYGYVILEEGGKIDVNAALSFSEAAPFAPKDGAIGMKLESKDLMKDYNRLGSPYESEEDTDYLFDITGANENITTGTDNEGENTVRMGLSMEEIQLEKRFWNKLPEGSSKLKKTPWMSYAHLSKGLGKEDFAKECFNYTFFSGEDIEAFWDNDDKTERNRFDLTGFTASAKTAETDTYDERMNANFWEPTIGAEEADLQDKRKEKIDLLIGAAHGGSHERAEFWKDRDEMQNYFDGKDGGFYYEITGDDPPTVTKHDDTENYGGIPWLDKMKNDDGGSVSEQVAANLIDYSDKDNIATTDFKLTLGEGETEFKEPTYCGNERVPYVNEFALNVEMTRNVISGNQYSFEMNVKGQVELINIYCNPDGDCKAKTGDDCDAMPDNLHVEARVIGDFKVRETRYYLDPDDIENPRKIRSQTEWVTYQMGGDTGYLALTGSSIDKFHLGYKVLELNGKAFPQEGLTNTTFPQPITLPADVDDIEYEFTYSIKQVIIFIYEDSTADKDKLCDVVWIPKGDYYALTDPYSPSTSTFIGPFVLTMQVNDPRCNMIAKKAGTNWDENYWKIDTYDGTNEPENTLGETSPGSGSYKGADNTNFSSKINELEAQPNDKDWEYDVKFNESNWKNNRSFSTAYIRNAPMESLWELGAIHRGEPFRTINLKKFSDPDDSTVTGKYSDGDAAILDYVKIGPLRFVKGRVNANTRNLGAIDILLNDIEEEWYDGSDVPSDNKVDYDISKISDTALKGYATSRNRGVMANILFDMLTDEVKTDRDAEALIGKTAGLLTTRLDTYSVYIVAEALREMRDIPDDTTFDAIKDTLINPVKLKHYLRTNDDEYRGTGEITSYCSVIGVQRMLVHLVRDAWRNEIKVERVQYLEK